MTHTTDQLAEVLEVIRQIEESEGFEGPRIAKRLLDLMMPPLKLWQDHVVGEIGRTCGERIWSISFESNAVGHYCQIFTGDLFSSEWRASLALAAAIAYRDAISATLAPLYDRRGRIRTAPQPSADPPKPRRDLPEGSDKRMKIYSHDESIAPISFFGCCTSSVL